MPLYTYEYTDALGTKHTIEQLHKFPPPDRIQVQSGDEIYVAERSGVSLFAKSSSAWAVRDTVSDLPPENAPVME